MRSPISEMGAALRGVLKGMHIHTLSSDLKRVHKDLHKIEEWVLDTVNNLEERVTSAFANHQDMIDSVEDRIEEAHKAHTDHKETTDETLRGTTTPSNSWTIRTTTPSEN